MEIDGLTKLSLDLKDNGITDVAEIDVVDLELNLENN